MTWIFRRHGYSATTNPKFVVSIICEVGVVVRHFEAKHLIPDAEDYVKLLEKGLALTQKKPSTVAIDAGSMVGTMRKILEQAGITAVFYPPPSHEELAEFGRRGDSSEYEIPFRSATCSFCDAEEGDDGERLLTCSRCKLAYYCCKLHQKADWKKHKRVCVSSDI